MKRIEGKPDTISAPTPEQPVSQEAVEHLITPEQIKDYLFDQYMKQRLLEDFLDELEDYLDPEHIDVFRSTLTTYDEEDISAALSLPKELRERKFTEFETAIDTGQKPAAVFRSFVDTAAKYKFNVGYHTSPIDIRPDEDNGNKWLIKGTEADHRDDDRMMAYYSDHYRHLFKEKNPKFIYVIRTDPANHKSDGNWNRADSLSVVMRVPYQNVVDYVEDTYKKVQADD